MRKTTIALLLIATFAAFSLGCGHSESSSLTGSWTTTVINGSEQFDAIITFDEDGTFLFEPLEETSGHNVTPGSYEISNSNITFTDDECGSSGVYSFSISDGRLSLTPDSDTCDHRASVISGTWNRTETE